jgi:3-deoxy-D-manno-octulosonic-acid transferase
MRSGADTQHEILYGPGARAIHAGGAAAGRFSPVLVPASWVYHAVSHAIRGARSLDLPPTPEGVSVVSVGNLEVGGGGKTPLAMHLLAAIPPAGGRAVYISRGYGGLSERLDVVTVVPGTEDDVGDAVRAGVRCLRRGMPGLAEQVGDEGAMVAGRLPRVPLLFCRNKARALEVAADVFGPGHVVMDDAFQSWGVPRDVDILLLDGQRPFGDGWLLPAGTLREPPEAVGRADFIGAGGVESESQLSQFRELVAAATGVRKPTFGVRRRIEIAAGAGGDLAAVPGDRYAALSGIGRPEAFERQLAGERGGLALSFRYPDHHRYTREDLVWVVGEARKRGIETIVTTEKDWVKLADLGPAGGYFAVARLTLELFGDDPCADIREAAG